MLRLFTMNRHFYTEKENLRSRLILMGERTTDAFKTALRGLLSERIVDCEQAIEMDLEIDRLEQDIESEAVRYISLRSPVASDLRMVMAALKAAGRFERIGDSARSVARRSKRILSEGRLEVDLLDIEEMAAITLEMLECTKSMILQADREEIDRVCGMDREVDLRNEKNLKGFVEQARQDPFRAAVLFELSHISKTIERVADHVSKVARLMEPLTQEGTDYRHVSSVVL